MDPISQGLITTPLISPSLGLAESFNGHWSLVMPPTHRGLPAYPFFFMRSEPFWQLVPNEGAEDKPGRAISSMAKIREIYAGARIDERLFGLMANPVSRERFGVRGRQLKGVSTEKTPQY